MHQSWRGCIARCLMAIALLSICARAVQDPRGLYQRAQMLDQSNQNLSEAIKLYAQVVSQARGNHLLAAQAQFRIGLIYERLGRKAEALKAFKALVALFPDQTELVRRAQAKIAAAAPPSPKPPDVEIIRSGPSLDGRELCAFTFRSKYPMEVSPPVIDSERHRLYAVTRGMEVAQTVQTAQGQSISPPYVYHPSTLVIMDLDKNSLVKAIPFTFFVNSLALDHAKNRLYLTALFPARVLVIDPRTLAQSEIRIEGYPGDICINQMTNRVYVDSQGFGGNDKLFVIDSVAGAVVGKLDLGGIAGRLLLNTATNRIYAYTGVPSNTRVFNCIDNTVLTDLPGFEVLEVDDVNNRAYGVKRTAGTRSIQVLDGNNHQVLADFSPKWLNDLHNITVDPGGNRFYALLEVPRQVAIFETVENKELGRLSFSTGPNELVMDRASGRAFLYCHEAGTRAIVFLQKGALDVGPEEFSDSFDVPELDAAWRVVPGHGRISLTESPGYLRHHAAVPSDPALHLERPFRGDWWRLEIKVSYSAGASGGSRYFGLHLGFGASDWRPPAPRLEVARLRGDWNGCCPGDTQAELFENGAVMAKGVLPANISDSYVWRIRREARTITVERSDDGAVFTNLASYTFTSNIDGLVQFLVLEAGSFENKDAYADYDYIRLIKTGAR